VSALSIACFNVFLIPLDVGNQGNSTAVYGQGGLPMAYITVSFFSISMIYMLILIPFTVFFYEGDDESDKGPNTR
jgi:LMBR1 domain-containing protein 1